MRFELQHNFENDDGLRLSRKTFIHRVQLATPQDKLMGMDSRVTVTATSSHRVSAFETNGFQL